MQAVMILSESYLRNEPVGHGNPDYTSNESRTAQEEKVPVEAGRLFEWELPRLCSQATDVLHMMT